MCSLQFTVTVVVDEPEPEEQATIQALPVELPPAEGQMPEEEFVQVLDAIRRGQTPVFYADILLPEAVQ